MSKTRTTLIKDSKTQQLETVPLTPEITAIRKGSRQPSWPGKKAFDKEVDCTLRVALEAQKAGLDTNVYRDICYALDEGGVTYLPDPPPVQGLSRTAYRDISSALEPRRAEELPPAGNPRQALGEHTQRLLMRDKITATVIPGKLTL